MRYTNLRLTYLLTYTLPTLQPVRPSASRSWRLLRLFPLSSTFHTKVTLVTTLSTSQLFLFFFSCISTVSKREIGGYVWHYGVYELDRGDCRRLRRPSGRQQRASFDGGSGSAWRSVPTSRQLPDILQESTWSQERLADIFQLKGGAWSSVPASRQLPGSLQESIWAENNDPASRHLPYALQESIRSWKQ